jgi:hypothetical protein
MTAANDTTVNASVRIAIPASTAFTVYSIEPSQELPAPATIAAALWLGRLPLLPLLFVRSTTIAPAAASDCLQLAELLASAAELLLVAVAAAAALLVL